MMLDLDAPHMVGQRYTWRQQSPIHAHNESPISLANTRTKKVFPVLEHLDDFRFRLMHLVEGRKIH